MGLVQSVVGLGGPLEHGSGIKSAVMGVDEEVQVTGDW